MADNRPRKMNNASTMGRNPGYGMPLYNNPYQPGGPRKINSNGNPNQRMMPPPNSNAMRPRPQRPMDNCDNSKRVAPTNTARGNAGAVKNKIVDDVKPKKQRDYFYVMRKGVCFFLFLLFLVTIALFALSYLKIELIPEQFIAAFVEDEASEQIAEDEEEEAPVETAVVKSYSILDPVFGFIKHLTGKVFNKEIILGDSPLYDEMLLKSEIGMVDKVAGIVLEYFPIAIIIYILTVLIIMFKAFFGIFGRRIFKRFGLGSIIMIICGALVALSGLAFRTEPNATMAYAGILDILIGVFTKSSTFVAGYGLLAIIAIPVLTLIFSIFARKKIPYSIFDN